MRFKKNSLLHVLEAMGILSSLNVATANNGNNGVGMGGVGSGNNNGGGGGVTTTVGEVSCVLQRIEPLMVNATEDNEDEVATTVCEMDGAYEGDNIEGIAYTLDESTFPYGFFKDVEYSETMVTISKAAVKKNNGKHGGGVLAVEPGASLKKEKKEKKNIPGNLRGNESSNRRRRHLAQTMGESTLIVLYAIPLDASNERSSDRLANDIFGITTTEVQDPVNVRSQMLACSRGQLNYIPACGTQEQACFGEPLIVNGVLEVPIQKNVTGISSGTVVNWVKEGSQVVLNGTGIDIYSFTQIMVIIPDEASWGGAAAWAYMPGQLSAFRDSYSWRMGVQMHEFGHNLGFGHSGFNGAGYADYSCLMGSPSYGDDGPELCWNAAKSWESGWYASDSVTVDPSAGVASSFNLVGVADWVNDVYTAGDHKIVLQIQDSTEVQPFYVIYNRAKGPNAGVNFAKDQVTISVGSSRTTSWHQAGLGAPNPSANQFPRFRKPNFNGGTKDLVIKVCGMTAGIEGSTQDTANVAIYLDDGPAYNNGYMCPGEVGCIADSDCDDGNWCTQNYCELDTNTCNVVDISASQCPTCGGLTYCNPKGYCDLVCDDKQTCTSDTCVSGLCKHEPIPGCALPGGLLETWLKIGGSSVTDLTTSYAYSNKSPDEVATIQDSLKTAVNRNSNYGDRLRTYLYPSATGTYNFYVASDDSSELWLSTDQNPANKVLIAQVNGWTGPEVWNKFTSQKSGPISLNAGSVYYLEALHKEGGGGDHLAVAWESTDASVSLNTIQGSLFFVEPPVACTMDSDCAAFITNPCNTGYCNIATTFCEYVPMTGCENGAKLETWMGIGGSYVSDLTNNARFQDLPDETTILGSTLEAPSNYAETFGRRLQTYIMPPVTCSYNFYIASDDSSQLSLSSDMNPANKVAIASVNGYTGSKEWFKFSSQKSAPIQLQKGQLYYLEALHKEGGGGDNLAIGWECLQHGMALAVIDASYSSFSQMLTTPQPSSNPTKSPSRSPSKAPVPTSNPTASPTAKPTTAEPTTSPTTNSPTNLPTMPPTDAPIAGLLRDVGDNGVPAEAFPLNACEGDCDYDSNCQGDLLCYQRGGTEAVPGCVGAGTPNKDYCQERPTDNTLFLRRNNGNMGNCDGNCNLDTDCVGTLICEAPNAAGEVPGCIGLAVDVKYCQYPSLAEPGAEAFPLGVCEGACNNDGDCQSSLECFLRLGTEAVPGCLGGGIPGAGYCTDRPSANYLWIKAENGSPLDVFPLGECEGDCSSDADCEGNLICEVRSEDEEVPGCVGQGSSGANYCRYPSLVQVGNNGSPAGVFPLWLCEGDCDNDAECQPGLLCFQRSYSEAVVGCSGTGTAGTDYCAERPTATTLFMRGDNGAPAANFPLGNCEGDCDSDAQCAGSLACFQRSGTENVPGCDGVGSSGTYYCYYAPSAAPTTSPA